MGVFTFTILDPEREKIDLEQILDYLAKMHKTLEHRLDGRLGSSNIREVGDFIVGQYSFVSRNGTVGISSEQTGADDIRFFAGDAVMANAPWRVYESGRMVAANADVTGKVTADEGEIGGWVISVNGLQSDPSTYPRVELLSNGDILKALTSLSQTMSIGAFDAGVGGPYLKFAAGAENTTFDQTTLEFTFSATNDIGIEGDNITIRTNNGGDIALSPNTISGGLIIIPSWSDFYGQANGQTLQSALNAKADSSTVSSQVSYLQSQIDGKANAFSGYTGTINVITDIDFTGETYTTTSIDVVNGIITSVS